MMLLVAKGPILKIRHDFVEKHKFGLGGCLGFLIGGMTDEVIFEMTDQVGGC